MPLRADRSGFTSCEPLRRLTRNSWIAATRSALRARAPLYALEGNDEADQTNNLLDDALSRGSRLRRRRKLERRRGVRRGARWKGCGWERRQRRLERERRQGRQQR